MACRREAQKEEPLCDLPSKGREVAIVSQTNIGTVSKATLGKLFKDWVEYITGRYHIELNRTEQVHLRYSCLKLQRHHDPVRISWYTHDVSVVSTSKVLSLC